MKEKAASSAIGQYAAFLYQDPLMPFSVFPLAEDEDLPCQEDEPLDLSIDREISQPTDWTLPVSSVGSDVNAAPSCSSSDSSPASDDAASDVDPTPSCSSSESSPTSEDVNFFLSFNNTVVFKKAGPAEC